MRELRDQSVGEAAAELVTGERQLSYGDPLVSMTRIAALWSALLGHQITPRQVVHMMILLKVSRDQGIPLRDNEVDICGYAHLLQFDRESTEYFEEVSPTSGDEDR